MAKLTIKEIDWCIGKNPVDQVRLYHGKVREHHFYLVISWRKYPQGYSVLSEARDAFKKRCEAIRR